MKVYVKVALGCLLIAGYHPAIAKELCADTPPESRTMDQVKLTCISDGEPEIVVEGVAAGLKTTCTALDFPASMPDYMCVAEPFESTQSRREGDAIPKAACGTGTFVSFDVSHPVIVFVGYDVRLIADLPTWLQSWEEADLDGDGEQDRIFTTDTDFMMYEKPFAAGRVELGPPCAGRGSMYTVALMPAPTYNGVPRPPINLQIAGRLVSPDGFLRVAPSDAGS